jgi:hypothetical protein
MWIIPSMTAHGLARGAATAAAIFVLLGTVAALWNNPFFTRMTPAGAFEIALLLLQSLLAGVYVGLPQSPCGKRTAGAGAFIGFLGGAALLALAVWLKLARPECLKAEAQAGSTPA